MTERRALALVAVLALLAMGLVVANGLVYDAAKFFLDDPRFQAPIDFGQLLTSTYWAGALWRPLTSLAYGVQALLGAAAHPAIAHSVSLLLYLLVVVVLTRWLITVSDDLIMATLAGALFAVHPVHVEVVASVVGQAELLASLGLIAGITVWHRAASEGVDRWTLPLLLGSQLLAALSKEQGFVLPILLLGQQLLLPVRLPREQALRLGRSLLLLVILLLLLRVVVIGAVGGETPLPFLAALGIVGRAVTVLGEMPTLVRLMLWPAHLQGEYGPPALQVGGPVALHHLLGVVWVMAAAVGFWKWRRSAPLAAYGVWWIVVTWLPTSSLVIPAGVMVAERLLFLPTIGLAMIVVGVSRTLPHAWCRRYSILLVVLLIPGFIRSVTRIPVWRDNERFFAAMTTDASLVYRAWYVRGIDAVARGDSVSGERDLRQAITLWRGNPVVHEALGQLLRGGGRCVEAIPIFRQGLTQDPARTQLRARLGECLLLVGDSSGAATVAREGIAIGQAEFGTLLRRAGE